MFLLTYLLILTTSWIAASAVRCTVQSIWMFHLAKAMFPVQECYVPAELLMTEEDYEKLEELSSEEEEEQEEEEIVETAAEVSHPMRLID